MKWFFKVHHQAGDFESFRGSNVLSIIELVGQFAKHLESETTMLRNEQDFSGLDLQVIGAKFVNKRGLRSPPAGWLPGEIGIWISNILALKSFCQESQSNSDVCLLLENDVWLDPEDDVLIQSLGIWLQHLPADWDYLNLYVAENWRYKYDQSIHEIADEIICKNYAEIHFAAILWSRQGAEKLLRLSQTKIHSPIDRQVFEDLDFNGYAIKPDYHANVSVWTHEALNNSSIQSSAVRILLPDEKS